MKFSRVCGVYLRYFYQFKRLDALGDIVFWPMINILMWGLTSHWLQVGQTEIGHVALFIMGGLLFWEVIMRTQYDISVQLLNDLWDKNLTNLFGSPLYLREWMMGIILFSFSKAIFNIVFCATFIYLLFSLNLISAIGFNMIPFFLLFTLCGWTLGFFAAGFLIYYGKRLQQLPWITPWSIAPFSAIFYPLNSLPTWVGDVAYYLPTAAFFEEMRHVLQGHPLSFQNLLRPTIQIGIYLLLTMSFFYFMFKKTKEKGLMSLD